MELLGDGRTYQLLLGLLLCFIYLHTHLLLGQLVICLDFSIIRLNKFYRGYAVRKKFTKYGLYTLSSLIGLAIIIGAQYAFFKDHEIGFLSYIAASLAGFLCLPFIFIVISKQSNITREQVLKIAVGLWLISIFLPLIGL